MYNLFSRSEIYELKSIVSKKKKFYINNYKLDEEIKREKIEPLNNFNKVVWRMEKDINSKTIKTLK